MKRWLLAFGLVLIAGCAGPRPEVPREAVIAPPTAWRDGDRPGGALAPDWWTSFGDPILTRTVEEALAHNDDVAIAAER
ncbi:MAG: RND transporter, partial [Caulobacteraceae bacterium]